MSMEDGCSDLVLEALPAKIKNLIALPPGTDDLNPGVTSPACPTLARLVYSRAKGANLRFVAPSLDFPDD